MFTTPIVFIIFNRSETTQQVFNRIRQIQPQQLLVIADGVRETHPDDVIRCQQTREIIKQVDWDCEVLTNFSDTNLGCAKRIETGLNWVFEQVESAIILEDDCLPDISFFFFAEPLLKRYADDERVMQIGGHNRLYQWQNHQQSYHFSYLYGSVWAWATWKRAWQCYNDDSLLWSNPDNLAYLKKVFLDDRQRLEFENLCEKIFNDPNLDGEWCYKWTFVKLAKKGLSLTPSINMVSHIGVGANATHIQHKTILNGASIPQSAISFPLKHPQNIEVDLQFEQEHTSWSIGQPSANALQPLIQNLIVNNKNINALILIDKALEEQPDSLQYNLWKAQVLVSLKQHKRAIPIVSKITKNLS